MRLLVANAGLHTCVQFGVVVMAINTVYMYK